MAVEMVIVRSQLSNTLYNVVEIDMDGVIVNSVARNATFEQAQNILQEMQEHEEV
jgi:hypothetical protein